MKLYHWKTQTIDLFVIAASENDARTIMIQNVEGWRWQDPVRFDLVLGDLKGEPYYVADVGHVISIDRRRTSNDSKNNS